jgi:beta-mannosidase
MSGSNSPSSPICNWVLLPEFNSLSPPTSPVKQSRKIALQTQSLSQNWEWKQKSEDGAETDQGWTKTSVPTEIFKDLFHAGKIKDPFIDRNEESVQWVGEKDWIYRTKFSVESKRREGEGVVLVFDGLDTFVDVFLNDKLILQSEVVPLPWNES